MATKPPLPTVKVGGAQIQAQQIELRPDVILDEIRVEGTRLSLEPPQDGQEAKIAVGEITFRASMSEPNLNRMLTANMPADAPVRNLTVTLFSGKARFTGQFLKLGLGIPFTVEGVPRIENGLRVWLDLTTARAVIGLPAQAVEILEQQLNNGLQLDLAKSPVPVYLDEIRCEPGRLTVRGRAKVNWPPLPAGKAASPFGPLEPAPVLPAEPSPTALPPVE